MSLQAIALYSGIQILINETFLIQFHNFSLFIFIQIVLHGMSQTWDYS